MDKELKLHLPKKNAVSRKCLLLIFILGQLTTGYTFFLNQENNPEVCFVNWKVILNQTLLFLRFAVCLVLGYLNSYCRRYGGRRICLYLLLVSGTSYLIVVHGLDSLAVFSWNQLKDNLIRRLDDSVIVIDENRNESTSMRRTEQPLVTEEHFRYLDEDVRFRCYDVMSFQGEVEPAERQVVWMHNNETVVPSWKFHVEITFDAIKIVNDNNVHSYFINSTLTIYLIEDRDFGNYSCHLKEGARKKLKDPQTDNKTKHQRPASRPHPPSMDDLVDCPPCFIFCSGFKHMLEQILQQNVYRWTGEFKLTKIEKSILTQSAPPGGIISFSASYLNLAEKQDISVGYMINDKPFLEVCSGYLNGCSLFVLVYWIFWHAEGNFGGIPNMFVYWLQMSSSILGKGWQCACPSTYGIHVFRFYRHFYNVTSGRDTVIEVEHPRAIRLIPRTADVLLTFHNDSKPEPIGEECFNSIPFTRSCSWTKCVVYELHRNLFLIENIIFVVMIILAAFLAYMCCKPIVRVLMACSSAILERSVREQETLASIGRSGLSCKYDVYISHSDSQWQLASTLASILEAFGKKVFYRERDVLCGDIKTEEVAVAIQTSCMFLVIVSREYINSGFQNGFELPLILNQIHQGRVEESRVMLYKHGRQCEIPAYFSNFTLMEILDSEKTSAEEVTGKLNKWAGSQTGNRSILLSVVLLTTLSLCLGMGYIVPQTFVMFENALKAILFMWMK